MSELCRPKFSTGQEKRIQPKHPPTDIWRVAKLLMDKKPRTSGMIARELNINCETAQCEVARLTVFYKWCEVVKRDVCPVTGYPDIFFQDIVQDCERIKKLF